MRKPYITTHVREALILRRWVLNVAGPPNPVLPNTTLPEPPPSISERGWELFLRAEHCALPLRRRLSALELDRHLPANPAHVLSRIALEETQRVIAARAQVQRISQWAASTGARVVILKGAVAAVDRNRAVDLSDIDLWVEAPHDLQLLRWLDGSGHTAKQHDVGHHHATRLASQLVAVEVHRNIPNTDLDPGRMHCAQPVAPELPGISRLTPADHLWHVLVHSTVQHIDRRGRIRDLLLLAHARSLCRDADLRLVHERADRHPDRQALLEMLDMAGSIENGGQTSDAFVVVAAGRYIDVARTGRIRTPAFLNSRTATTALLFGSEGWRLQLARVYQSRSALTPVPVLRQLQRLSPRFGGALVLAMRLARRIAALAFAWPRARAARRLARSV